MRDGGREESERWREGKGSEGWRREGRRGKGVREGEGAVSERGWSGGD